MPLNSEKLFNIIDRSIKRAAARAVAEHKAITECKGLGRMLIVLDDNGCVIKKTLLPDQLL